MPTNDLYRMLYERNVLWIDPNTQQKQQQQTSINQNLKNTQQWATQTNSNRIGSFWTDRPATQPLQTAPKTSPIPNIKDMLTQRNQANIQYNNQVDQQRLQPQIQATNIQQNVQPIQWLSPTNQWFNIWQEALDHQLRIWSQMQQNILQDYKDDIAAIKLQDDWVRQRFKNADQILARIQWVESAYKRWITDPQQIAMQTWLSLQEVQSVIRWEAFRDLQLQDRATEYERRDFEYQMQDLKTARNRQTDQLDRSLERLEYTYQNQVDDIIRQSWLQHAQMKKVGAITWQINSSGYLQAMSQIKDEANRNLWRLKTMTWRERDDIATARIQLMEDFENNTIRIKDYFDRSMDVLRWNWLWAIQQIQQQYGIATENTTKALRDLHLSMEQQKGNILMETMRLQQTFNDRRRQEIDILERRWQENDLRREFMAAFWQNPQLAQALYPEMAWRLQQSSFENFNMQVDFSSMPEVIEQFKWQARARNNNPWWITYNAASNALKQARQNAGIQFEQWSSRPANEWWNYVKFATIWDGIEAQWIALSRQWWDIHRRLQARVWTAEWPRYADQVMWRAWIPKWTRFEDLTAQQKQNLQSAVIRKESPWLHKLIEESNMKAMWWTWKFDQKEYERVRQILNNNNWVRWAWESVLREANRINDMIDWIFRNTPATVRWTQALIPGTRMYEMKQLIESMKSNIWIDKLLEIKSSWAWLWQVPQSQLETLQSMLWNIRVTRNPSNLKADIDDIIKQYNWIITRVNQETEFIKNEYPQYAEILMPRMDQQQTMEETKTRDQWYTPSPHLLGN